MIKKDIQDIRHALEEHLGAINGNTEEIQSLFDYLSEVELKFDKLSLRLDRFQLSLGQPCEKPQILPLTQLEKKIFLVLYTEDSPLSQKEIVERSALSADFVREG